MSQEKTKRNPAFREDLCDLYGLCFHLCPVLQLPLDEAKKEVQNLIEETYYTKDNAIIIWHSVY